MVQTKYSQLPERVDQPDLEVQLGGINHNIAATTRPRSRFSTSGGSSKDRKQTFRSDVCALVLPADTNKFSETIVYNCAEVDTLLPDGSEVKRPRWVHFASSFSDIKTICEHFEFRLSFLTRDEEDDRLVLREGTDGTFIQFNVLNFQRESLEMRSFRVFLVLAGDTFFSFAEGDIAALLKPLLEDITAAGDDALPEASFLVCELMDAVVNHHHDALGAMTDELEVLQVSRFDLWFG